MKRVKVTASGYYDTNHEYKVVLIREGTELTVESEIHEGIRGSFYLCRVNNQLAHVEKENAILLTSIQ